MMKATKKGGKGKVSAVRQIMLAGAAVLCLSGPVAAQEDRVPSPPEATLGVETVPPQPDSVSAAPDAAQADGAIAVPDATGTVDMMARQASDNTELLAIADAKSRLREGSVAPDPDQTLFFTAWQHSLLQEAKIGFTTRRPNPGEVAISQNPNAPRDPGIRELTLGGIAFGDAGKWTVWLNGVRVTPEAIPDQVMDIKVSRAYIDLKWFDRYTNKIYPVRLRPHERFNLDSRIFLPGTGTL
ncbi:MAG: hypothetical protein HYU57_08750 [Micavibrio aeruginosavorus]|nr:hypothetical protein [Micavibrio aeruginosavorus]